MAVPGLAGEQVNARIPDHAFIHPLVFRNCILQTGEAGHIADGENVVRNQHRTCGCSCRDDTPGKMKLTNGFNQQRAVAETLSPFRPPGRTIMS